MPSMAFSRDHSKFLRDAAISVCEIVIKRTVKVARNEQYDLLARIRGYRAWRSSRRMGLTRVNDTARIT